MYIIRELKSELLPDESENYDTYNRNEEESEHAAAEAIRWFRRTILI